MELLIFTLYQISKISSEGVVVTDISIVFLQCILVLCHTSKLILKIWDLRRYSSDCGVLCLAIDFDVLSA